MPQTLNVATIFVVYSGDVAIGKKDVPIGVFPGPGCETERAHRPTRAVESVKYISVSIAIVFGIISDLAKPCDVERGAIRVHNLEIASGLIPVINPAGLIPAVVESNVDSCSMTTCP